MTDDARPQIRFVLPSVRYKDSFLSAMAEFQNVQSSDAQDRVFDDFPTSMTDEEFQECIVDPRLDDLCGINIPKGWVAGADLWIVDKDGFAGTVSLCYEPTASWKHGHIGYMIRPSKRGKGYATRALRFMLAKAAQIGLKKVLLVYNDKNIPSKKIIMRIANEFGGEKINPSHSKKWGTLQRQWINTQKSLEKRHEKS